jgi:hypothetical protein
VLGVAGYVAVAARCRCWRLARLSWFVLTSYELIKLQMKGTCIMQLSLVFEMKAKEDNRSHVSIQRKPN